MSKAANSASALTPGDALFTDGSVNPQLRIGVGGFLVVPAAFLRTHPQNISREELATRLQLRRFVDTTSTRLELETLLWALAVYEQEMYLPGTGALTVYTDCQAVAGLAARRVGLEKGCFLSQRSGEPLTNAPLYRLFYAFVDRLGLNVVKVAGHAPRSAVDSVQAVFATVDRGVRRALGQWRGELAANVDL